MGRKKNFGDRAPSYLRVWMTAPPPPALSEGVDLPLPQVSEVTLLPI